MIMGDKTLSPPPADKLIVPVPIREIQEAVARIRFGTVQLIIQDGRVVQIDTTEKKRLA